MLNSNAVRVSKVATSSQTIVDECFSSNFGLVIKKS